MPAVANSTSVDFIFNNLQAYDQFNTVNAIPNILQLERQSATQLTQRQPGGIAYRGNSAVAAPSSSNAAVLLDGMETMASALGYAKNGAFLVTVNAAAVVVPLTNTATNTNGVAGDTSFANVFQYTIYNLSGLDGNNASNATFGMASTNTAGLGFANNGTVTIAGSSRFVGECTLTNGWAIAAATANLQINSSGPANVAVVISGK